MVESTPQHSIKHTRQTYTRSYWVINAHPWYYNHTDPVLCTWIDYLHFWINSSCCESEQIPLHTTPLTNTFTIIATLIYISKKPAWSVVLFPEAPSITVLKPLSHNVRCITTLMLVIMLLQWFRVRCKKG